MRDISRICLFRLLLLSSLLLVTLGVRSQALPEGEGRDETLVACTACHGLDNLTNPSSPLTSEDWEFHLYDMIARGAPVHVEDIEMIRRYLVDNFAVDR